MEKVRLHSDGPAVSPIVWGLWRALDGEETRTPEQLARMIALAVELGMTSFDLADIYGGYACEPLFGKALKLWGGDRGQIQLITKCGIRMVHAARPEHRVKHYDAGNAHISASVDHSLLALGTDYVDLLLLHRPDYLMDAEETAWALEGLVCAGKVRHVGLSNHSASQLALLQSKLSIPLLTNQIEFSITALDPLDNGTLDQAQLLGFRPMAWSPLGGGVLFLDHSPRGERVTAAVRQVMAEIGAEEPAQVALAWLMRHPSRPVPVIGSGRSSRLRGLMRAADFTLDRQQWYAILEASRGEPAP